MKALIVVDMQKDFIDGVLGTKEAVAIVPAVKKKIEEYRKREDMVIFTRDTHGEDYLQTQEGKRLPVPHCIKDTPGWKISSKLKVGKSQIIDKPTFGSYELVDRLWELNEESPLESIELVGLCTDICVITNAMLLKTRFPETLVTVDGSCCAGVMPETHETALKAMEMCQIEVK
ncbi:MAG: isochorismatase family cysteine hydrolase [Bacillota bacterium]|nr:isochorismatase family cysteine hydrolase [Bacillota bacterium]